MDNRSALSWKGPFYTLLAFTVLNIAFVARISRIFQDVMPREVAYTWIGDDYPTELPLKLPPVALEFDGAAPAHFALLANDDWAAAFTPDFGFTTVGPAHLNRTFQLAMQHQMHCLDALRVALAMGGPADQLPHSEHCLRYLRQSVLCYADTTLEESAVAVHNGRLRHLSQQGYGVVHRCRDWTALRRYQEEHPPVDLGDAPEGAEG
ncbi:hypothetical protein C2E23DRAFT_190625 [Lenzites betulinus]|nr:hypothetical protein C2E23DRAFT_190625 [Lenzites betulinus]